MCEKIDDDTLERIAVGHAVDPVIQDHVANCVRWHARFVEWKDWVKWVKIGLRRSIRLHGSVRIWLLRVKRHATGLNRSRPRYGASRNCALLIRQWRADKMEVTLIGCVV